MTNIVYDTANVSSTYMSGMLVGRVVAAIHAGQVSQNKEQGTKNFNSFIDDAL